MPYACPVTAHQRGANPQRGAEHVHWRAARVHTQKLSRPPQMDPTNGKPPT